MQKLPFVHCFTYTSLMLYSSDVLDHNLLNIPNKNENLVLIYPHIISPNTIYKKVGSKCKMGHFAP